MSIRIRLACNADIDAIAEVYRPIVESTTISFETNAPDQAEMARRVRETLESYPWLVCELEGNLAGYAYATRHRARAAYQWSVDTSVYVDAECRRRGVGRGLYESLFAILAVQGYFNAYAGIALPNPASIALHESMGFEPIGVYRGVGYKLGRWCDVGWWQRSLRRRQRSPEQPQGLAAIAEQPGWEALVRRGESLVRAGAA
jgi:L-amino acid N-acyltransferase YncA